MQTQKHPSASLDSESDLLSASLRSKAPESGEVSLLERSNRTQSLIQSKLASCKLDKLKVDAVGLVGREKEVSALKSCLSSMMKHQQDIGDDEIVQELGTPDIVHSKDKKELVFLKGYSGVGKTSLARSIEAEVRSAPTRMGKYVEGKFDINTTNETPYDGIAKAFSELIRWLKSKKCEMFKDLGQELSASLGSAVETLTYLIPELEEVVDDFSMASHFSEDDTVGMQERWKYGFRVLTRLLTSKVSPLVMVIDDLQWADRPSLDLIDHLISDVQNPNPLMIIGCYRSNEVDESSVLTTMIKSLGNKGSTFNFNTTSIEIDCCGMKDVNEIISRMLDADQSVGDLAELCFRRTLGNPFFTIEFMVMLHKQSLLTFNIGRMKWGWDTSTIEESTMSTANVAELLQTRVQGMDLEIQQVLQYAACLGPSFRVSTLETIWDNLQHGVALEGDESDVATMISVVEDEMLIETCGEDRYRWVHDSVQEASMGLIKGDLASFQFEMGRVLFHNLTEKELQEDMFDVANLISSGNGTTSVELATFCLETATKSKKLAAFHSASKYIANGIGMLPDDKWIGHRSLSLEMYTFGAKIEFSIGCVKKSEMYGREVLSHESLSPEETFPLKLLHAYKLAFVEVKHNESVDYCNELLQDVMGFRFFRYKHLQSLQALGTLPNILKRVQKQPKGFYKTLGTMSDEKQKAMAGLLFFMHNSAHHCHRVLLLVMCVCKIVEMTLDHGLCEHSAPAFASLASIYMSWKQEYKGATALAETALSMQEHYGRTNSTITMYIVYTYVLTWTRPLHTCEDAYFEIYMNGMREGTIEYSLYALVIHFLLLPYMLGKPIGVILEQSPKILAQAIDLAQPHHAFQARGYGQVFLNLSQGDCVNPTKLEGEALPAEELAKNIKSNNTMILGVVHYYECQLLFWFDDPSFPERAIKEGGMFLKYCGSDPALFVESFHRGVGLYRAACRTSNLAKKRRYKKHAMAIRKTIAKWKQNGNPNAVYYSMFLDAMHFALKGKHDQANELFLKAIVFVCRGGYLHHAALFNELYAEYVLDVHNDISEHEYRIYEAIRYYREWGALAKVEILTNR